LAESSVFRKGVKLHQKRVIQNISTYSNRVVGYVFDEKTYEVSIEIDMTDKTPTICKCDCDYFNDSKICEHSIALLLEILYTKEKLDFSFNSNITNTLIDRFTKTLIETKEDICQKIITVVPVIDYSSEEIPLLSLKIGINQLYIIKDIPKFIQAIHNMKSISFGKNFRYNPELHAISDDAMSIINNINEFLTLATNLSGFVDEFIIQNQIRLPESYWNRILPKLWDLDFEIKSGSSYTPQLSLLANPELVFDVYEKNDIIHITSPNTTHILLEDTCYVIVDELLYQLDPDTFRYFKVIHEALKEHHNNITVEQSFKHNFASSILPVLKQIGKVNLGPQINKTLYTDTLVAEIYLDQFQNTVKGTITFSYGDYKLHILPRDTSEIPDHVTIIQDLKKEAEIMNLLKSSNCVFDASNDYFTIIKEDFLYDFIYDTLPALQEIATVYYSDDFKKRNCFTRTVFVMFNRLFNILCTGDANTGGDVRSALNHYEAERQRKGGG
jgi:hypothetical protein